MSFKLLLRTWGQFFFFAFYEGTLCWQEYSGTGLNTIDGMYFFTIAYLGYACILEITALVKYPIQVFLTFQKFALSHITFLLGETYIVLANQEIRRAFSLL